MQRWRRCIHAIITHLLSPQKHVEGSKCDSCKRSFFNLQSDDPQGCVPCFCFGVSADCKCADYYKEIVSK